MPARSRSSTNEHCKKLSGRIILEFMSKNNSNPRAKINNSNPRVIEEKTQLNLSKYCVVQNKKYNGF